MRPVGPLGPRNLVTTEKTKRRVTIAFGDISTRLCVQIFGEYLRKPRREVLMLRNGGSFSVDQLLRMLGFGNDGYTSTRFFHSTVMYRDTGK